MTRYTATINGEPVTLKHALITEEVDRYGSWSLETPEREDFQAFATCIIRRDGSEAMRGPVVTPHRLFSRDGSGTTIRGYNHRWNLTRFLTGTGTITEKTVEEALQEMLDNSPSNHGLTLGNVDTFYLVKQPNLAEFDTTIEMLKFTYVDAGLEFDVDTFEVDEQQIDPGNTYSFPVPENRTCFVSRGGRIFVFVVDGSNNVKYTSSEDGTNWASITDTGYNASNSRIDVTYDPDEDHVHLMIYTGSSTSLYEGTISGSSISFTLQNSSIFSANRYPVCSLMYETAQEHLWTIDSANHLWESTDDGVTWSDKGALTHTGEFVLPAPSGSDMYILEYDAANNILKLYKWDSTSNSETYVKDIYDFDSDVMLYITATIDHQGKMHIACTDDDDYVHYFYIDTSLNITHTSWSPGGTLIPEQIMISVDNVCSAYVAYTYGAGVRVRKYTEGSYNDESDDAVFAPYGDGLLQMPIKNRVGFNDQGGFIFVAGNNTNPLEPLFTLFGPYGISVSCGETSGSFKTPTVTGDGDFERWGMLSGIQTLPTQITYDIEDTGSTTLASGLLLDADLHGEGVPTSETSIVIEGNIQKTGSDYPYVHELYVSERWTKITNLPYDYESFDSFLRKLAALTGGEYDLNTDNTIDFVEQLGTDWSSEVTLEEGVNIKTLDWEQDYSDYANIQPVFGSGTKGVDRVEVTVMNASEVAQYGEYWAPVIRDPELTSKSMAWNRGSTELSRRVQRQDRIKVRFLDNQSGRAIASLLRRGDTVSIVSPRTGLNTTARIISLTREWGEEGEQVSAVLGTTHAYVDAMKYLTEIDLIKRVI